MNDFNAIFQLCEAIGTAAFAVSGAMVAIDKGTDIFGVLLMAVFTALGGGTLRDVLIGHFPPRMFTNFHYVLLSCICALAVFIIARIFKERYIERERLIEQVNNVFDAIGLGIFAVSGARIGMEAGFADNIFLTTFLGTTTAIGRRHAARRAASGDAVRTEKARVCRCSYCRRTGLCAADENGRERRDGVCAGDDGDNRRAHSGDGVQMESAEGDLSRSLYVKGAVKLKPNISRNK